jgi:PKD repeat protein
VSLRAEIRVGGITADFGTLSARSVVTGTDGRATLVYTAPLAPSVGVDTGTIVDISVTPIGSDFNNATARVAAIRLVPPGLVVPPDGLKPSFTVAPTNPSDNQTVLFDATASTSGAGNPIVSYSWSFGDSGRAAGPTVSHAYGTAGSYVVTLTIADAYGRTAQTSKNVDVSPGLAPTAAFTSSPSDPLTNQPVNFNGAASRAAPGRTIRSYDWDFGDGTFGQGITTSHAYAAAHGYVAVLTVTDDTGKKGSVSGTVTVK